MIWLGMDENHTILSDFQQLPDSRTRRLRFGTSMDTAPAPWLGPNLSSGVGTSVVSFLDMPLEWMDQQLEPGVWCKFAWLQLNKKPKPKLQ